MDHLKQNINNLSDSKTIVAPTHGASSYFVAGERIFEDRIPSIKSGDKAYIVCLIYGSLTSETHRAGIVNPLNEAIDWPIGVFQLDVFGKTLSMSNVVYGHLR